ncbi:hypothetical protein [Dongia sp.]|uniref:hypothetical protein n=1 Tax=Dongia sp. TaxID=1977262 RepID=UPI0035B32B34
MRLKLLTAIAIFGLPITSAFAIDPSPEGTAATIAVKLTVRDQSKGDWHSANVHRVMTAQCVMRAAPASQVGSEGMSAEQEAAQAQAQADVEAFAQDYGPSEDMMAQIEAGAAACGDDEACLTAMAMKLSQTAEMQAMAQKAPEAKAAMAGLTPDMGPVRYQMWHPESCSGTVTIDDSYVHSDSGGEGGYGAYTDNVTASGTVPLPPEWVMAMETDLVAGTTTYSMRPPPPVTIQVQSSHQGPHAQEIPFLASAELPAKIGPVPGIGAGSTQMKGATGTLSAEWSLVK